MVFPNKSLNAFISSLFLILILLSCTKKEVLPYNPAGEIGIKGDTVVKKFKKLNKNEVLVYKMIGPDERTIRIYANSKSRERTRLLGEWANSMKWGELQFSIDQRKCVFVSNEIQSNNGEWKGDQVYYVDGDGGVVIFLMNIYPPFVLSLKGTEILYEDYLFNKKDLREKRFMVYDIPQKKVSSTVSWEMPGDTLGYAYSEINVFYKRRQNDGTIKIFYTGEDGIILAAATINPKSGQLSELWCFDLSKNENEYPKNDGPEWQDDLVYIPTNPDFKAP
jgi:hypothetical protein